MTEESERRIEKLRAEVRLYGETLWEISDILNQALQFDTSAGVKWLTEENQKNYLRQYPATRNALRKIQELIDDALD